MAALRGDAVIDALLHEAGVLRFHSSEELFDVAQLFESQPLPRGRRIGIVSNSASVATLAADASRTRGLEAEKDAAERRTRCCWGSAPDRRSTPRGCASCSATPASMR